MFHIFFHLGFIFFMAIMWLLTVKKEDSILFTGTGFLFTFWVILAHAIRLTAELAPASSF